MEKWYPMKQVERDLYDLTLIGEEEIIVQWDGTVVSNETG